MGSWLGCVILVVGMGQTPAPLPAIKHTRGDIIPFRGEISDIQDVAGRVTKRQYKLEIKVIVLETEAAFADCGVLTMITPQTDAEIVTAAANVTGTSPTLTHTPLVRLDRIRISVTGETHWLPAPDRPPPFPSTEDKSTLKAPEIPLNMLCPYECGFWIPRPKAESSSWALTSDSRAKCQYESAETEIHNGSPCRVISMNQPGPGWDDYAKVATAWKRTERMIIGPTDGLARTVTRTIIQREGNTPTRTITTQYEMKATMPVMGASYRHVRKEVEYAAWAKGILDAELAKPKPERQALEQMQGRLEKFMEEHRPATDFRPALEAELLRVKAVLKGAPR